MLNIIHTALLASVSLALAAFPARAGEMKQMPMTIVAYEAGEAWKAGLGPEKQNLAPHFAYVEKAMKDGLVLAFGTQADAVRGYYVLDTADQAAVDAYVAGDPGTGDKVLRRADTIQWNVLVNAFAPKRADGTYFILRYRPGANWIAGKSVAEQDIRAHLGYIAERAKAGVVVAGGPNATGDEGIYIISLADAEAATDFVGADPGVAAGIFKPEIVSWNLLGMRSSR